MTGATFFACELRGGGREKRFEADYTQRRKTLFLSPRNRPPRSTPAAPPAPHRASRGCSVAAWAYLERARLRGLDAAEEEVLALVRVRASCSLG